MATKAPKTGADALPETNVVVAQLTRWADKVDAAGGRSGVRGCAAVMRIAARVLTYYQQTDAALARWARRRITPEDAVGLALEKLAELAAGAPNCWEADFTVHDPKKGSTRTARVSVQWADGRSLHDLLAEAREERNAAVRTFTERVAEDGVPLAWDSVGWDAARPGELRLELRTPKGHRRAAFVPLEKVASIEAAASAAKGASAGKGRGR